MYFMFLETFDPILQAYEPSFGKDFDLTPWFTLVIWLSVKMTNQRNWIEIGLISDSPQIGPHLWDGQILLQTPYHLL